MSAGKVYLWVNNEVVIKEWGTYSRPLIRGVPCVDTGGDADDPHNRYGQFNPVEEGGWRHTPLEKFPKEFRVHLLLLGVP